MAKVELGFTGERFIYLPIRMVDSMENDPLTGDLYIYSMGYFSRAEHHYIDRPEGCNEYLFIYCKDGSGWVTLYHKKEKLKANQFIILPRHIPHTYQADEQDPWTIYWIHFKGNKAPLFAEGFDRPTHVPPSAQSRIEERLDLFEEIFSTLNENTTVEHMQYANLCFSHFMGSFLFIQIYQNQFRPKEYSEHIINRVIHYMNDSIECNLKLKDFATFCGYSDSYFYRKFIKETGYSPMEYFTRMKIEKACKLLIHTDMKINQISHKLGFREAQYFSRTFTRITGSTASGYRKQNDISPR